MQKQLLLAVLSAALAVAALVVHLTVPLGALSTQDGNQQTDHGMQGWSDVQETGSDEGLAMHEAPFASFLFGIVGGSLLIAGSLAVLVARIWPYQIQSTNVLSFGVVTAGLGASFLATVHGLWLGPGIEAILHAATGMDAAETFWPVAPWIVLATTLAAAILMFVSLGGEGFGEANDRARRHALVGILGLTAILLVTATPWTAEEAEDALGPDAQGNVDMDRFVLSAKSVLALQEESRFIADAIGEGDVEVYVGLGNALRIAMFASIALVAVACVGLIGVLFGTQELLALGRNLEFGAMAGIAAGLVLAASAFLGPLLFFEPNDGGGQAVRSYGPMLAAVVGAVALSVAGRLTAQTLEINVPLQMDDFEEPIVFE